MSGYKDPPKHTQYQKGQSGNPGGRPKRPDIDALNETIAKHGAEAGLALAWLTQALGDKKAGIKPDFAFFKLLIEYRNGKVPENINLASSDTSTIVGEFLHGKTDKTAKKRQARKPGKRVSGEGGAPPGLPGTS